MMTQDEVIKYLSEVAEYFDKLSLETEEDRTFWAHRNNASNCRKIVKILETHTSTATVLTEVSDTLRNRLADLRRLKHDFAGHAQSDPLWEGILMRCKHEETFLENLLQKIEGN